MDRFAGSAVWGLKGSADQGSGQGGGQDAGEAAATLRGFWAKLAHTLARVPFAEDLVAAYYCVIDRDTPPQVRATLAGALAYFLLPADAVPDILAGLGFTDDAAVLVAALKLVGGHVTLVHRAAARAALERDPI
ncbi:YkvA family protein [Blastochloris sulfoviridis]|uniref:DUF1232 domain-containing protein n=1 Tax=Blastochloris sulfoviridis TaxID=50712 RepID=A0A5M6I565_9HYPH|nr:YkvA family protein [Blastochloris sulfoviridis]KAA5603303.1 DUF1232 domain-containing protein [Blastochloris sulfoviridis]